MIWADISTHDVGSLRIVVHRNRGYSKITWAYSCRELNMRHCELRNKNITDAQKEALHLVREKLRGYCKLIELIDEEIGI